MNPSKSTDLWRALRSDAGYALPSVLFLILLLSTIAISVLQLALVDRKLALRQVHQIQAEFAAQNGVYSGILQLHKTNEWLTDPHFARHSFTYPDESIANVATRPWGSFILIESEGLSRDQKAQRRALLASQPQEAYSKALILGNVGHSLVMTGSSTIVGDVEVGKAGVSTGSLMNHRTPSTVPIDGKVSVSINSPLPRFDKRLLQYQLAQFDRILSGGSVDVAGPIQKSAILLWTHPVLNVENIPDSVQFVRSPRSVTCIGALYRRGSPLYLSVNGSISMKSELSGPVAVCASDSIIIEHESRLLHTLVYSRRRIDVASSSPSIGQFLSPRIEIGPQTGLEYPSALISVRPNGNSPDPQLIVLRQGVRVEGSVMMIGSDPSNPHMALIMVDGSARIIGSIYSDGFVTLDGEVLGSALIQDLYFHEPPTTYIGWLRTGRIDRRALPDGYLVGPSSTRSDKLEVLAWL